MPQLMGKKSLYIKFLLDENVDIRLSSYLKKAGFSVKLAEKGMKNSKLINLAKEESCVLITNDKDFANKDLYNPADYSGIIVFRIHPPILENLIKALNKFIKKNKSSAFTGKTFIISE